MRHKMSLPCRAGLGRGAGVLAVLAGVFITALAPLSAQVAQIAPVAPAAPATPEQVVEKFHETLLSVMKDAARLGYRGRLAALTPEVARAFHLSVMTRIVAGRYWKKFTTPQKQALVKAFSLMTTATYANRFDGYGGEKFQLVKRVEIRKKTVMVKTRLVKSDGEAVNLDYLLRRFKKGWRVIDIYLDGSFSELATRRSEYSSVLRRKGLDALIGEINQKVARYAAEDKPR
jgi:phospholipid transport system substrate-binding protein